MVCFAGRVYCYRIITGGVLGVFISIFLSFRWAFLLCLFRWVWGRHVVVTVDREVRFFELVHNVARGCLNATVNFPRGDTSIHLTRCRANAHGPGTSLAGTLTRILSISPRTLSIPSVSDCVNLVRALFALRSVCNLAIDRTSKRMYLGIGGSGNERTCRLLGVLCT